MFKPQSQTYESINFIAAEAIYYQDLAGYVEYDDAKPAQSSEINAHLQLAGVEVGGGGGVGVGVGVGDGGGGRFNHIIELHVMNYQQEMATNAALK